MSGDDNRIGYLMSGDADDALDPLDLVDLAALRAALADATTWDEPSVDLGDRVVALIAASGPETGPESSGAGSSGAATTTVKRAPGTADAPAKPTDLGERRARRLRWLGGAAIGAAAASAVAFAIVRIGDDDAAPKRAVDVTIPLAGTDLLPGTVGSARITSTVSGLEIEFIVPGLPRRDGDEFYEAWLKSADGKRLIPVGTFHEGGYVILWAGVAIDDYPILTVTREKAAGPKDIEQGTSGEIVVSGRLNP